METKDSYVSCIKCGNLGIEKQSEILPDKGILCKVFHDNGQVCEFVEYQSLSIFLEREKRKKDKKSMKCPICGINGLISSYRPNKSKKSHHWNYFITHERLEGFWGKEKKIQKYRRCYLKAKEHKDLVLKRLGHNV